MGKLSVEEEESIEAELEALQRQAMPSVPVDVSPSLLVVGFLPVRITWLICGGFALECPTSGSLFGCLMFLCISRLSTRSGRRGRGRGRSSGRRICGWR